jgi:hypothetical protein
VIVTVDKNELLTIIRQNRDNHRATFEKAVKVYTDHLISWHRQQEKRLLKGETAERFISFPVPEEHTDDYDTLISMLEMHRLDQIDLEFTEYNNYVRDNWRWSASFTANTASYTTG